MQSSIGIQHFNFGQVQNLPVFTWLTHVCVVEYGHGKDTGSN